MEGEFWLVWNPDGFPLKFQHEDSNSASVEAARLADASPGRKFFVLKAEGYYITEPVVKAIYHPLMDLPF